jgi:hypothetical protein
VLSTDLTAATSALLKADIPSTIVAKASVPTIDFFMAFNFLYG